MRDVEVGVEAQLAQPRADARQLLEQLVAQAPERRVQRLVGAEQLLGRAPPTSASSAARACSANGDGGCSAPRSECCGVREHEPAPRARHRRRSAAGASRRRARRGCRRGSGSRSSSSGSGSAAAPWRAPGMFAECRPSTKTWSNSRPLAPRIVATATPDGALAAGLLLAQARLGDRGDRARELARRRLRRAAHVVGGELAEAREVAQPLDDVGVRGEELLAAQAEPLDQPVDEEVRAAWCRAPAAAWRWSLRNSRIRSRASGDDLRRLGGGDERADHVELAPPRDLDAAREVAGAQLDRRARERAHGGARVVRVGEQPQPREHVAHLGALEERRRADDLERHRALLQRDGDRLALVAHRPRRARAMRSGRTPSRIEALDVGGDALGLRALVRAAPELDVAAGRRLGQAEAEAVGHRRRRPRARRATIRSRERNERSSATTVACERRALKSRRFFVAAPRNRATEPSSSPATVSRPCAPQPSSTSRCARSKSWYSSTSTWRKRSHSAAWSREQRDRAQHEVAGVERALLGEQRVVVGVQLGELALALAAARPPARSAHAA